MTRAETDGTESRGFVRVVLSFCRRVITDLVVVGFWVGILTLVFLSTGGPRWLYYSLLLVGIVCYTQFTTTSRSPSSSSSTSK